MLVAHSSVLWRMEGECYCTPQFHNQAKGGKVDATQHAKVNKVSLQWTEEGFYVFGVRLSRHHHSVATAMCTSRESFAERRVRQHVDAL